MSVKLSTVFVSKLKSIRFYRNVILCFGKYLNHFIPLPFNPFSRTKIMTSPKVLKVESTVDVPSVPKNPPSFPCIRYIGIIFTILSSALFALSVLIVKILARSYHPYTISFWRFLGFFLPSIPVLLYFRCVRKQPILDAIWPLNTQQNAKTFFILLLRCVTGATSVFLQFYSLQYISMGDSTVIVFCTPVFVSLAGAVFLGEKSGFIPVLCGFITLLGVCVITRPPMLTGQDSFDEHTLIGAGMAIGSMFLAAATFLLLRYLRDLHFSVNTFFFGLWGSLQAAAFSTFVSQFQLPESALDWQLVVALSVLVFGGLTLVTLAFQVEQAGTVALCRTFDIVFSYVWQLIFLGVMPDMYSFIGAGIVIVGVVLAACRKFVEDLPEQSKTKKVLWILLK